jgi:asparagine synthase (glutamine-hydrolysing)
MCGIAGIISRESSDRELRSNQLEAMLGAILHRGPDGHQIWSEGQGYASLAHCRLAILDLSPAGAQPMHLADRRLALVFNGEIYNYVELRRELATSEGVQFEGHSDTEVLLNALCHWGVDSTLKRLVGMFAFALWDGAARTLHLVRDRVGKKPLYYCNDGMRFYFASEIKAFKAAGLAREYTHESVYHYLSLGFVPSPDTIYTGIHEVMPGHRLRVDAKLQVEGTRYWAFPMGDRKHLSLEEATEETEARLIDSVKLRLRSDVPVGVFLSGGIDSGLITAIAAQNSPNPIRTFTVSVASKQFDEALLARQVADRYGTDHHELRLTSDVAELLPVMVNTYDQPFADPSALPTLAIARETSHHVKVVLNGEGGDELFGGYRRHQAAKHFAGLAAWGGNLAFKLASAAAPAMPKPAGFRTPYSFLYRFLNGLDTDPFRRYLAWSTDGFKDSEKRDLFRDRGIGIPPTETYLAERFAHLKGLGPLDHFMNLDFELGMAECLLAKIDRATMAYGLEGRSPFLDHRMVEWAGSIDRRSLLRGPLSKPILRSVARRYLPENLVGAPKRGFDLPMIEWTQKSLRGMAMDLCLSGNGIAADMFDREILRGVLENRAALDAERWAKRVWLLLMLELWGRSARH